MYVTQPTQELCLTMEFGTLRPRKCDNKFCAFCKKSTKKFVKEERCDFMIEWCFWSFSFAGLTQSLFCWKAFVKLQLKRISFLILSSILVESKMEGFILGSKSTPWKSLIVFEKIDCTSIFRGVRSSHMYYKAGERESPESWTGNWRIESLKVGAVQNQ